MFRPAGTAEIIRSHQKDDSFSYSLKSAVADIAHQIAGPRIWIQWRKTLDIAAEVAYLLLTTCSDLQSVGEEYVNIILTDSTRRALPSKWRRLMMVLLQVCVPHVIQSSLVKAERLLQSSTSINVTPATRERLLNALPLVRRVFSLVHRCHLAMFYIHGVFYHIAKRFTGIHYVQYMAKERSPTAIQPFKILGYLSALQLLSSMCIYLGYIIMAVNEQKKASDPSQLQSIIEADIDGTIVAPGEKCPLCLGRRQHSTLTPCGHLFCWSCIHDWCISKQECPLCRDQFPPNRLIALQNFDRLVTS